MAGSLWCASRRIFIATLLAGYALPVWGHGSPRVFVIFFSDNSAEVDPSAQPIIQNAISAWHRMHGRGGIWVIGYTDISLSTEESQHLSEQRASNLADAFANLGVPQKSLFVEGRGPNDLRVPTAVGVREPQNERVELIIISENEARRLRGQQGAAAIPR